MNGPRAADLGLVESSHRESTRPVLGRRGLAVLSVGTFTLGVDGFVLAGLLPQVAASLHVSTGTAGQLTTIFALVYALGSPVIATATGSWDRRAVLAGGMLVFLGGVVVQATGPTFAVVAFGRVLAALGAASFQATAYGTAGILSDDAHRARSLAVVAGGSSVALVVGLPFGVLMGQMWGWRSAMWVLAALATLSAAAVAVLPAAHAPRLTLRQRSTALTDRRVLAVLVGTVTVLTPGFLVLSYLPAIISEQGAWVVAATLGFGAGQVAGTSTVSALLTRADARTVLLIAAGGVVAATAVLTVTRTVGIAAVATMVVLGLSVGLAVVPQQTRLFTLVPRLATIAVGLNGSAIYLASAAGAAIGGAAIAVSPDTSTVAGAGIALLGVLVAATLVPERFRVRTTPATSVDAHTHRRDQ